ncbi:chemoreceptor glutamine deamidase CheD [Verticiella sediminum]|uniref:Probable chemoreceptor glutamine deamidase CheD n=1 Tax=Verticiella sediminum TaxID=1247510 RepID=A0A556ARW6_9BURK|nr:chemoreceptor glutamine deamidase CheD [Verticiella sediminum]TSH95694.1 chemoreceptor glutamine deamidase CheD [Verticiella sediminum]
MLAHAKGLATHRHYDSRFGCDVVKLLPNEYYVTGEDIVLATVLGSCVAACIADPVASVGGMNHFMLPGTDDGGNAGQSLRYGAFAMELLVNELLKMGARRERLEAKVFGGGAVIERMRQMNIGERNAAFVLDYLATEQIPVVAQDLCGDHARRVNYLPRTGKVLLKRMNSQRSDLVVACREQALRERMPALMPKPQVELFHKSGLELFTPMPDKEGR